VPADSSYGDVISDANFYWIYDQQQLTVFDASSGAKLATFGVLSSQKICGIASCCLNFSKNYLESSWLDLGLYVAVEQCDSLTGASSHLIICFDVRTAQIISTIILPEKVQLVY